jgi:hypothetical protein
MKRLRLGSLLIVWLLVGACDAGSTLPEVVDGSAEIEGVTMPYLLDDDRFLGGSVSVEIVAPISGGPWPVVVMFHGNGGNPDDLRAEARRIASRGRVVFNTAWQRVVPTDDTAEMADLLARQAACAVAFARVAAPDLGGDPEHLTLFGFSAGGNIASVVAFGDPEPLATCADTSGGPVSAVVMLDPALLLVDEYWDGPLAEDPDVFYALTPWRDLDGTPDIPVYLLATDSSGLGRSLDDPSWVAMRHPDIDLLGSLGDAVADGYLSLPEVEAWAGDQFDAAGYTTSVVTLPDSTHIGWSAEAREIIWDTVVAAEEG